MRMTMAQALDAIGNLRPGETFEDYKKRMKKLRRYGNERDDLADAIALLDSPEDQEKRKKKRARLEKVLDMIEALR